MMIFWYSEKLLVGCIKLRENKRIFRIVEVFGFCFYTYIDIYIYTYIYIYIEKEREIDIYIERESIL